MPYLSIIIPTMRVGGLDVLFDSLAAQTFTDFELVLVDGIFEKRRDLVQREARDRFLCVRHVGLRPSPFPNCAFCAYANSGIVASSGDVLLFMVDYSRLPPDLLAKHAAFHRADTTGHKGLMGPHQYAGLDVDPRFPKYDNQDKHAIDLYTGDLLVGILDPFLWSIGKAADAPSRPHLADGGASVPADADPKLRLPAGAIGPEFFHAKNESVRRERVIEINGWDVDLDGAHLYQDSDFSDRLAVKAGVQWELDPTAIVDIVNPRPFFPFARRTRPPESNFEIWQAKKAAGYPDKRKELHLQPMVELADDGDVKRPVPDRVLKVVMIYGEFSSAIHGPFDLQGLYTRQGLTGSESSFFNLARTLSENGHEVGVFCDCADRGVLGSGINAVPIKMIGQLPSAQGVDVVIAWNEPDYLKFAPAGALRICDQQLNDFGYCREPNWRDLVDVWVSPSASHCASVMCGSESRIDAAKVQILPNSVDLDFFMGEMPPRDRGRVVWCSSPDRGLHHLLGMWALVRKEIPEATLKIFYRLDPWLARVRDIDDDVGRRARYIEEALPRLRGLGVEVAGMVPNAKMADELRRSAVLAYPCDPVRYTEGFGCSVLDAAAGGCVPITTDADALAEVHGAAATVIPGPVDSKIWADAIVAELQNAGAGKAKPMFHHATAHDRRVVTARWEEVISHELSRISTA